MEDSQTFETIDVEIYSARYSGDLFGAPDLGFEGVDIIIPVYNNNVHLAFVFIGDIERRG